MPMKKAVAWYWGSIMVVMSLSVSS